MWILSCTLLRYPDVGPERLTGANSRIMIVAFPLGSRLLCLLPMILDRWATIGATCSHCERSCPICIRRRQAADPAWMLDLEGI